MFIKFSDKTKKIIVKAAKDGYDAEDTGEDGESFPIINLYENKDNNSDEDRRVHILNDYLNDDKKE